MTKSRNTRRYSGGGKEQMSKNENLHKAKDAKKDEFYTQYEDIYDE